MGAVASLHTPHVGRTRASARFTALSLRRAEPTVACAPELHAEVDMRRPSTFSICSASNSGGDMQRLLRNSSASATMPGPLGGARLPRQRDETSADDSSAQAPLPQQRGGGTPMPLVTPELLREVLKQTGVTTLMPTSPDAKSATTAAIAVPPKPQAPEGLSEDDDSTVLKSWASVLPPPGILYNVERATRSRPSRPTTRGRNTTGSLSSTSSSSLSALQPPTVSFTGVSVLTSPCRVTPTAENHLSSVPPINSTTEVLPPPMESRQHPLRAKAPTSRRFTGFRKDFPVASEASEEELGNSLNHLSSSATGGLSLRSSQFASATTSGTCLGALVSPAPFDLSPPSLPRFGATDAAASATRAMSEQLARATQEVAVHAAHVSLLLRCWGCVLEHYESIAAELGVLVVERHPEFAEGLVTDSATAEAELMLNAVGEAVVKVPRPDEMFTALLETGAMQRRSGISDEHFLALQSAFMAILPKYLPAELQDTYEAAWTRFWKVTLQVLEHGRTSARGEWHAADQQATFLTEARRVMDAITARKTPAERGTFMLEMLEGAVAADPSMERFSILRNRRSAVRAFNGIMRVLDSSNEVGAMQLQQEDVTFHYSIFGVDSSAMRVFRQPFIDTCHYSMWKKECLELWQPETPRSMGAFWDYVAESWAKAIAHMERSRMAHAKRAPDGTEPFCLMFTDIEASTRLWERNAAVMGDAVEAHHRVIRGAIADYGAYEVKTVGDSFVIAAKNVLIAVRIALTIQLELMRGPIANGFDMVSDPQGSGTAHCWRSDSLRVRVGIHYCRDASAVYDSVQRRYDYYGPSVNCTARVESAACGGQILMTRDALEALQAMPEFGMLSLTPSDVTCIGDFCTRFNPESLDVYEELSEKVPLADLITVRDWGEHTFKGIEKAMQLYSVVPKALSARVFNSATPSPGTPSLVLTPMETPLGHWKNSLSNYLGGKRHTDTVERIM